MFNTVIYSLAVVFTYKEGQEFILPGECCAKWYGAEPAWKLRMEKNITRWLREADILREFACGKLRKRTGKDYAQQVMKWYAINGDKDSINKAIFVL